MYSATEKPLRDELALIDAHHYPEVAPSKLTYILNQYCNATTMPLTWCRKHDCHVDPAPGEDLCLAIYNSECQTAMRKTGYLNAWANDVFSCPSVKRVFTQGTGANTRRTSSYRLYR